MQYNASIKLVVILNLGKATPLGEAGSESNTESAASRGGGINN